MPYLLHVNRAKKIVVHDRECGHIRKHGGYSLEVPGLPGLYSDELETPSEFETYDQAWNTAVGLMND